MCEILSRYALHFWLCFICLHYDVPVTRCLNVCIMIFQRLGDVPGARCFTCLHYDIPGAGCLTCLCYDIPGAGCLTCLRCDIPGAGCLTCLHYNIYIIMFQGLVSYMLTL